MVDEQVDHKFHYTKTEVAKRRGKEPLIVYSTGEELLLAQVRRRHGSLVHTLFQRESLAARCPEKPTSQNAIAPGSAASLRPQSWAGSRTCTRLLVKISTAVCHLHCEPWEGGQVKSQHRTVRVSTSAGLAHVFPNKSKGGGRRGSEAGDFM